jgi:hypothetical protein
MLYYVALQMVTYFIDVWYEPCYFFFQFTAAFAKKLLLKTLTFLHKRFKIYYGKVSRKGI